jgi:hypothetical protein
MKAEIASLHDRMAQGGNWWKTREEIAALHAAASTQEEYVILLEAHRKLVAVSEFALDEETRAKILPIATTEYQMFLYKEAMEDGELSAVLLERITRREVEAGRLDADSDFRKYAVAGLTVIGDSAEINAHRCKQGDWFFLGMAIAAILSSGLVLLQLSPLWLIALGIVVAYFLNERERKRIKASIAARRVTKSA